MKRVILSICAGIGCLALSYDTHANSWQSLSKAQEPTHLAKSVFPVEYQLYRLEAGVIKEQLLKAGTTPAEGVMITVPLGNGEFQTLKVFRDNTLSKELQAKFPDIHTFTGFDPQNHSVTAKLGFDLYGFNAMVIKPGLGTYMIDPYSKTNSDVYIGFLHRDLDAGIYKHGCGVSDDKQHLMPAVESLGAKINVNNGFRQLDVPGTTDVDIIRTNGSVKRTYRLAISCTGEWAQEMAGLGIAPTIAGTLADITTLVNRSNGVFQRELSVKMEIIPNNETIVYINAFSDPYTCDNNNDCLIDEVQTHFNSALVGTTYDIGHILNTAGGGLAQLSSVCNTTGKARGVSGASATSDISTIIHEMGHQMGTPHTFTSDAGGCSGQGSDATAYEPGSGSSIMSYNGACDADNVESPAYDYYHIASLMAITDHISLGPGSLCGVTVAGFGVPTIMTLGQSYTIPTHTPFELIADEFDYSEPAAPSMTYSWEQWDLGSIGSSESGGSTNPEGATFVSRAPDVKRDRQFPDNYLVIESNYSTVGQRISLVSRDLNFKLTNRTLFEGWGTFNYSDDSVNIKVTEMQAFRVRRPDVTALYEVGSPIVIEWDTSFTRQAPIMCGFVNIHMSLDGGETFPILVAANVPNMGTYNLAAPDVYSDNIYFKVKASGNIFYDISKRPVQIHGNPLSNDPHVDIVTQVNIYPNPADKYITLENALTALEPLQVVMVDVSGRIVYSTSFTRSAVIDVEGYAKGNYLLNIKNPVTGKSHTEKVVIN